MATKKLSEALAELQKAANVSGLDIRLVVAGQSSTDNAQTITLQQLLTAINVPTVQTGAIGNNKQFVYSISTDNPHAVMSGTFKAFQFNGQCLIRHKFWGSTNDYTDGQYTTCEIPKVTTGANGVFEAAMLVRLRNTTLTEVNSTTDKVVVSYPNYANGSTKSLEISKATTAKAGVMTAEQVSALEQATTDIASLNSNMPTPQVGTEGYEGKYIFSHKSDNDRKVLSGNFKVISVNTGVEIQHRVWGATAYTDATIKKAQIPIVNPSQYGVMNKDVFKRMLYHTHYESGSSTKAVNIKYTNYETGGTNDLTISAASSAKAGVMTSEQYNQLADLSKYQCGCLGTYTMTSAFKDALSNMPKTHKGKYGRYYAKVSDITVFVTFIALEESSNTFSQWIEGAFIKSAIDDDIYLNNELGVHIIGRVYRDETWGIWRSTVLDDEVSTSTSTKQYLKWNSANHKYTYVATEAESDAVIPIASATQNGLMSKENSKSLSDIQTNYKDFGHFASENAALSKITDVSVCADSNIVHAHMTYANGSGKTTLILIQSIDGNMCRQIIYNKMKVFHRTITFTDANRSAIQTKEDWMFLFGDRLVWSTSGNKYVLSQFGNGYGHSYCSPIPTATNENDGLMSKSQVSDLATLKTKVDNVKDEIPIATDSRNGLMSMVQFSDLKELKKTAKRKKTIKFPPCVHKAIPLMPKKGRTYYNSRGHFHFDVKKDILEKNGIDFTYVDNVIGSLVGIKILGENIENSFYCKCISAKNGDDLTKYYHINNENWQTLFGYAASKVQFEVKLAEENTIKRYILEILSDEEVIFSNNFKFKLLALDYGCSHETSSPFWFIEDKKVSYIRPITNNFLLSNSHLSDNAKAFYYKACKKKTTLNGKKVSVKKRWKRVSKNTEGYNNLEFNRRAFKFRVYPCYKKWRRTIINKGSFVEVLRDNNCNIKKILP